MKNEKNGRRSGSTVKRASQPSHSENAASEPKKFLEISGTHNEGFITSGKDYEKGLNAFILEHIEPRT